jgi:hypothetical protein
MASLVGATHLQASEAVPKQLEDEMLSLLLIFQQRASSDAVKRELSRVGSWARHRRPDFAERTRACSCSVCNINGKTT